VHTTLQGYIRTDTKDRLPAYFVKSTKGKIKTIGSVNEVYWVLWGFLLQLI